MDEKNLNWPVTVMLFSEQQYGGEWIPEGLTETIAWLQGFLDKVPVESRDKAGFEIGTQREYDCEYATITISYQRPPTDEEKEARLAEERLGKETRETQERREYERLRAKFND